MKDITNKILSYSKADECIVLIDETVLENIRWANSTTTTNGTYSNIDIAVISIIDGAMGTAYAGLSEQTDLKALVHRSELIAKQNKPAEDKHPLVSDKAPSKLSKIAPSDNAVFTKALHEVFKLATKEKLELFGYAELKTITYYLANSSGLFKQTSHRLGQIELNAKNFDRTISVWAGQSIAAWEDQQVKELYAQLQQKVGWSKNKLSVDPGEYDVILEPSAVADLLIYAYWESAARDADEGRTVFHQFTKEKPAVFPKDITIYSDPHEPSFECRDFQVSAVSSSYESVFDNGMPLNRSDWIAQGTVQSFFTPRYYAAQTGREPKAFTENLIFSSQKTQPLEEIIKSVKDGLLVTCLWYIREVDPKTLLLTGLTRDGVFVIKNGKVIGAANNFRFNMSPIDMLKNIKKIGKSQRALAREFGDYFTLTKMPPLLVSKFNMSSKSDAL